MAMGGRTSAALALALAAAAPAATAAAHQAVAGEIDRSLVPYADPKDAVVLPDGRRVHMVCMGRGSPTVVFTAGAGDWSLTWSKVQPAVAKATRACAWDRAGFGLSAPPASPQTVDQTTGDLQAALRAGRVAGPYVLVGHSLGGYESLLFADRLPGSVAGMVLVDPSFPDQLTPLAKAAPAQAAYMLTLPNPLGTQLRKCSAAVKAGTLIREGPDPDRCFHPQWPPNYPPEMKAALDRNVAAATTDTIARAWETMLFYSSPDFLATNSKIAVNPRRNYGDLPLIVLTRTDFNAPPDFPANARAEIPAEEAAWNKGHDEIAALSSRGINARVPGTGHYIHDAKPQVVVDAIVQVVREAREGGARAVAR
jgi:pimeloyl-ACP methyl ester carboxylesterase